MNIMYIVWSGAALIVGLVAGYFVGELLERNKLKQAKGDREKIIKEAEGKADEIKRKADLDAKEMLYKLRVDFDKQTSQKRNELYQLEKRLAQREENLEKRLDFIESKEREISRKEEVTKSLSSQLEEKERYLNQLLEEEKQKLQRISSLSAQEAREILLRRFEDEMKREKAVMLKEVKEQVEEEAEREARDIVSLAIQRCAVEHATENTVSVVALPNDEMKGRVIGREGRNIRAFEMATGVDLVIDDTPEAVALSSFDPIRREVARIALEKLVADGRIHPARIEEIVEKVRKEFEKKLIDEGKAAVFDIGIHNLHPELMKLLGKLKYRTSFGQNALQHAKEVAFIMSTLAAELNLDARLAKRVGLLHDVGKAIDHQVEGTHSKIGADLLRKYGENEIVVNAAEAHHEEEEFTSIYSLLALVGDAVSASRPGARRETLETYIKRLRELEKIANSFSEVDKSYAIQAGREVRVIVYPSKVSDEEITLFARNLKKKVEDEMEYPGQIRITVIRETRAVDYAK